jgi:hypothetical protein
MLERQEKQQDVYRSYADQSVTQHWTANQVITGTPDDIADSLAQAALDVGADAINLRVQVPGVQPEEMMNQINALGPMLAKLRTLYPWKR